jgi:hypothetical protein
MIMKKVFLILCFVLSVTTFCLAQEMKPFSPRVAVGFVPQYTISGGLRFDIDRSISKTSNQWLVFSPQVFMVTGSRYGHDFEDLSGVGMDVKHKIYLKPGSMKPSGYYVQYGIMFQYFSINEYREYTESYIEDGAEYYEVVEGELNTRLYKYGGNFHLGYQWLVGDKVYFDIYAGAGIRISHNNHNDGFDTWYNNYWVDYGYSGTLLDGGFRVGVYF